MMIAFDSAMSMESCRPVCFSNRPRKIGARRLMERAARRPVAGRQTRHKTACMLIVTLQDRTPAESRDSVARKGPSADRRYAPSGGLSQQLGQYTSIGTF